MEFDELKTQIKTRIGQVVGITIDDLTDVWLETFGGDNTRDNLDKLVGHVQTFMNEICEETVDRQSAIQQRIAELLAEHKRLQSLLQVSPKKDSGNDVAASPLFHRQVLLDQQIQTLRDQLAERHAQIQALCNRELNVCTSIGEQPRGLPLEPLPSGAEIEIFEFRVEELKAERELRAQRCAKLRNSVRALCAAMGIEVPRSDARAALVYDPDTPLSLFNVGRLESFVAMLQERKATLRTEIRTLQKQLRGLYGCLEMSPRSRAVPLQEEDDDDATDNEAEPDDDETDTDDLAAKSGRYTKPVVDRLRAEIERCERIKRQNIQQFVEALRRKIVLLWERTMRSDKERARFTFFTSDFYNEDMLQLHELELADLERFYADNALLFQRIEEHRTLWQRLLALEAKEKEPGRYKNRGGQLLIEEKERRAIATKVPKILAEITQLVDTYAAQNPTRPFTIWGRPVDEHIASMHDERTASKEQQMSARKAATATPRTGASVTASGGGGGLGVSSVQRSMMMGTSRTPASVTRVAVGASSGAASLKRMASVTNINTVTSTKKLRIQTAGVTPAKPIKRNILSELPSVGSSTKKAPVSTTMTTTTLRTAAATAAKLTPHRFVQPAMRSGTATPSAMPAPSSTHANGHSRVVATLASNNRRRSRRKSHNKSASKPRIPRIVVSDYNSSDSYSLFEERVQPNSRSSIMAAQGATPKKRAGMGAGHTPAKVLVGTRHRRSRSPSAAIVASSSRHHSPTVSPSLAKLSARNLPFLF